MAREPQRLPQMLQDSNIFLAFKTLIFFLFGICCFLVRRRQSIQRDFPVQPHPVGVGDSRSLPAADPPRLGKGWAAVGKAGK